MIQLDFLRFTVTLGCFLRFYPINDATIIGEKQAVRAHRAISITFDATHFVNSHGMYVYTTWWVVVKTGEIVMKRVFIFKFWNFQLVKDLEDTSVGIGI